MIRTTINTANKTKLNVRFSFTTAMVRLLRCYIYYSFFLTSVWNYKKTGLICQGNTKFKIPL